MQLQLNNPLLTERELVESIKVAGVQAIKDAGDGLFSGRTTGQMLAFIARAIQLPNEIVYVIDHEGDIGANRAGHNTLAYRLDEFVSKLELRCMWVKVSESGLVLMFADKQPGGGWVSLGHLYSTN